MPLFLIGMFALMGWGLFALMSFRVGKHISELKDALAENAKLVGRLEKERKDCNEALEKLSTGAVDTDSLNRLP